MQHLTLFTFKAPQKLGKEALRVARLQNKTRSELIRELLEREVQRAEAKSQ